MIVFFLFSTVFLSSIAIVEYNNATISYNTVNTTTNTHLTSKNALTQAQTTGYTDSFTTYPSQRYTTQNYTSASTQAGFTEKDQNGYYQMNKYENTANSNISALNDVYLVCKPKASYINNTACSNTAVSVNNTNTINPKFVGYTNNNVVTLQTNVLLFNATNDKQLLNLFQETNPGIPGTSQPNDNNYFYDPTRPSATAQHGMTTFNNTIFPTFTKINDLQICMSISRFTSSSDVYLVSYHTQVTDLQSNYAEYGYYSTYCFDITSRFSNINTSLLQNTGLQFNDNSGTGCNPTNPPKNFCISVDWVYYKINMTYYAPSSVYNTIVTRDFVNINTTNFNTISTIDLNYNAIQDQSSPLLLQLFSYNNTFSTANAYLTYTIASNFNASQKGHFWNVTSHYQNYLTFDQNNFSTQLDLYSLVRAWLPNRTLTKNIFSIGVQAETYNYTSNDIAYLNLNFTILGNYSQKINAYTSLSTNLTYADTFTSSVSFLYIPNNIYHTNTISSSFVFQIAIQKNISTTNLQPTYFIQLYVTAPTGKVYASWLTDAGTIFTNQTGIILTANQEYTFVMTINYPNSQVIFSILDSNQNYLLQQQSWTAYTTNQKTLRPALFSHAPLGNNWKPYAPGLGYYLTLNATTTNIFTGQDKYWIDQIYSSTDLLNTGFYQICTSPDFVGSNFCTKNNIKSAKWNGITLTNATAPAGTENDVAFSGIIRDFRSFTGMLTYSRDQNFPSSYDVQFLVQINLHPIFNNGTISAHFLTIYLQIAPGSGTELIYSYSHDNVTVSVAISKSPPSPANSFQVGFGFYFYDMNTLAVATKYYNSSSTASITPSYATFTSNLLSPDVQVVIRYFASQTSQDTSSANNALTIDNPTINSGYNLPYEIPFIPDPEKPYVPTLWDNLLGGLAQLGSNIVNFPGNLFGGIANGIFLLLSPLFSAIQGVINQIFGWIQSLWNYFWTWLQANFPNLWNLLTLGAQAVMTALVNLIMWLFTQVGLGPFVTVVGQAFQTFVNGLVYAFTQIVNMINYLTSHPVLTINFLLTIVWVWLLLLPALFVHSTAEYVDVIVKRSLTNLLPDSEFLGFSIYLPLIAVLFIVTYTALQIA